MERCLVQILDLWTNGNIWERGHMTFIEMFRESLKEQHCVFVALQKAMRSSVVLYEEVECGGEGCEGMQVIYKDRQW